MTGGCFKFLILFKQLLHLVLKWCVWAFDGGGARLVDQSSHCASHPSRP